MKVIRLQSHYAINLNCIDIDFNIVFYFLQMVFSLAMIIYNALDFSQSDDEERIISHDLESLIEDMIAGDGT